MSEPLLDRLALLVQAAIEVIAPALDCPFAIFGHSMGALIAFEAARAIAARWQKQPAQLIVSGHNAPTAKKIGTTRHLLADEEFIAELRALNGTPDEVLSNPELLSLMLPILRADFSAVETWTWRPGPPLKCPLTALGGAADPDVRPEELAAWCALTTGVCTVRTFPGDHFYLAAQRAQLLAFISSILTELLDALP